MICATLVNTQTDSFWPVMLLAELRNVEQDKIVVICSGQIAQIFLVV